MDRITRWETAAMRRRRDRPQPGTPPEVIDLRDAGPTGSPWSAGAAGSGTPAPAPTPEPEPPPDADPEILMVPLDAWNRMLNQLGNLHEAGRDLAEARERAARAETEAAFLRERLSDLRDELDHARDPSPSTSTDEPATPGAPDDPAPVPTAADIMRSTAAGLRGRLRRR